MIGQASPVPMGSRHLGAFASQSRQSVVSALGFLAAWPPRVKWRVREAERDTPIPGDRYNPMAGEVAV